MIASKRRKQPSTATYFDMSITDIGEELEGVIVEPEIIVHAGNRATLIRKAERELRQNHGILRPVVKTKAPSGKPGNKF
jgi:hypothetical protein